MSVYFTPEKLAELRQKAELEAAERLSRHIDRGVERILQEETYALRIRRRQWRSPENIQKGIKFLFVAAAAVYGAYRGYSDNDTPANAAAMTAVFEGGFMGGAALMFWIMVKKEVASKKTAAQRPDLKSGKFESSCDVE